MAHIEQLSPHVADLIAAGEVVERPASVVKELVENALDAGADAVSVEIRSGGMALIRVRDNGCGIPAEEVPTAFLRHATSKLKTAGDLGAIGTLGFRGEALAAIAAVSRLDITTRTRDALTAATLHLEGGVAGEVEETGAPTGTVITVADLFYNTPARLKFMKKDTAETAAVSGLMQHLALSHPDVAFRFVKDGVEALNTPGDGHLSSAVYAALGRDFAGNLLEIQGRGGDVAVSGFITRPLAGRGSRNMQTFFVNGRFIKSQLLTAALEEGYRNQIMKGRFPGCVLHVTLPTSSVDVNVHPAKTQVKFAREKEVFSAVYHTVADALEAEGGAVKKPAAPAKEDFFQTMDARTYRESVSQTGAAPVKKEALPAAKPQSAAPPAKSAAPAWSGTGEIRPVSPRIVLPSAPPAWDTEYTAKAMVRDSQRRVEYRTEADLRREERESDPEPAAEPVCKEVAFEEKIIREEETAGAEAMPAVAEKPADLPEEMPVVPVKPAVEETPAPTETAEQQALSLPGEEKEQPWRIVGEVLKTYIVCEDSGSALWLIDKHAAHERVNFDRMLAALEPPMRQQLLTPLTLEGSREDGAVLLENLPALEELGFSCEDFGGGAVLVREIPADIDAADALSTLEELAEALRTGRNADDRRQKMLHTMACKAAIKAGMDSSEAELRALVERVQTGEIRYCPHGRPVAVKLTKYELEKMFKRA